MRRTWLAVVGAVVLTATAWAQNGDRPGEVQRPLPADLAVPPAPVLSDEEALAAFTVAPGYRVELVASHPQLFDPVAMEFGPDGRIWVVEMRGYMHDVEGAGEELPIGTVAVLADEDGDGFFEKRTEFAGGLVMPRALSLAADGVLVGAPPYLYYFRDTDGDDVADERTIVADDYGSPVNPEHTANGLFHALDNWIYSANHGVRHRYHDGEWIRGETTPRGQWGMDQDDGGRLFYNSNSDPLRVDLVPSAYFQRHPGLESMDGLAVQTARSRDVPTFPGRITPGINRGYQMLDETWKLPTVTAACGPMIYRGVRFGPDFRGNAFFCEPSGNLVKRLLLTPTVDGSVRAANAYPDTEFLVSTDERFRPVNAYNGPDGAIYLVDFYRGIIQHRIYLTTFLRNQIEQRGLDAPLGRGRIWKIVPETPAADWVDPGRPALDEASVAELVETLDHPNGWWRDTAQRLLVEHRQTAAVAGLREMARQGGPLGRQHALWTLAGLERIDRASVLAGLTAADPRVQVAALQVGEPWLRAGDAEVVAAVLALGGDTSAAVQRQMAFALGEVGGAAAARALVDLAQQDAPTFGLADAVKSGTAGREAELLDLIPDAASPVGTFVTTQLVADLASREPPPVVYSRREATGPRTLSAAERALFEKGRTVYALCMGCHQADGRGMPGMAASLVASPLVEGDPRLLARIVLHGKAQDTLQMPALAGGLDDESIAAVLTYVRRSFGHNGDPVMPETVTAVRAAESGRSQPWTTEELATVPLD